MTPQDVTRYLDTFINYEKTGLTSAMARDIKLARVQDVLDRLDRPDRQLRCVHVAGTKGKGSTCAFVAGILAAAGCRVGLYTSPHLWDLRERIRILGPGASAAAAGGELFPDSITIAGLGRVLEELRPVFDQVQKLQPHGPLTFFEVLTVTALYHFRQQRLDAVVLETGMGGRLDATNAVDGLVCGITPVSLEHTRVLGATLRAIAREKGAIIKHPWQNVVVGRQQPEAAAELQDRIRTVGCRAYTVGREIGTEVISEEPGRQEFFVRALKGAYRLTTRLAGRHQRDNAAMAVGIAELFSGAAGLPLTCKVVEAGVASTVFPGRFEIVREVPLTVLDAAHNPDSARALAETVRQLFPGRRVFLLLGMSEDKDRSGICAALTEIVSGVMITRSAQPRAADLDRPEVRRIFSAKLFGVSADVPEGLSKVQGWLGPEDILLVTGSIFVVAEARKRLAAG